MQTKTVPIDLELVAGVFNRLSELEYQGYHDKQTFYTEETVWALLTAMGQNIDMQEVESGCLYYGQLLNGVFSPMTAGDLESMLKSLAGEAGQGAKLCESDFGPPCDIEGDD